ncbi:MAG: 3'(2'),5'-bisphosphate nucleotidase CysQ [Candidatus Riflebacteria bacterium]|nr:3'(2'),5'-bisphosphate nucleotidase CysQ [Candidatus Riflebacteria bacterium]
MNKKYPFQHEYLDFALTTALAASDIILDIYNSDFKKELKDGNEPVTEADRAADMFITAAIKREFPNDSILSEECGSYVPDSPNGRAWFIDPIDGTAEFIKKNGQFAIQMGLAVDGEISFGLVLKPVGSVVYVAATGQGCWTKSSKAPWQKLVAHKPDKQDLVLASSISYPSETGIAVHKILNGTKLIKRGGVGLKLMAIAGGEADYYINDSNKTKAWDVAAPEILFKEAGGLLTEMSGKPFRYDINDYGHKNGLLASNDTALHSELLKILKSNF